MGFLRLQVLRVSRPYIRTLKILGPQRMNFDLNTINMQSKEICRWAFSAKDWQPKRDEILAASSFIQAEEKKRISKFYFLIDAMTSLIGRLMLRKYVHHSVSMSYDEIRFGRDTHGKPYLMGVGDVGVTFNVSHQGDYVVLAGDRRRVGIDVMKIEPPKDKNIPEFFRLMNRQFSAHEWAQIKSFPTDMEQVACFYRFWCLKESYVKNTGVGITVPLEEISFAIKTRKINVGEMVSNTILYLEGVKKEDWVFEETLLDEKHSVAVSIQTDGSPLEPVSYRYFTFYELIEGAKPLHEPDPQFADDFMSKKLKLF